MLAAGDYQISPTKFHNSVHNAASGYYSIAVASHRAVTSLCAFDDTATAALLETAVQAIAAHSPVLMVCYDLPYPYPLSEARPTIDAWSLALVLAPPEFEPAIAQLTLIDGAGSAAEDAVDTALADPLLDSIRLGNPTARMLPLFAAIAQPHASEVVLRQAMAVRCGWQPLHVDAFDRHTAAAQPAACGWSTASCRTTSSGSFAKAIRIASRIIRWPMMARFRSYAASNTVRRRWQFMVRCWRYVPRPSRDRARHGFLVAASDLRWSVERLDQCAAPLTIEAVSEFRSDNQVAYDSKFVQSGAILLSGHASVLLDAPVGPT